MAENTRMYRGMAGLQGPRLALGGTQPSGNASAPSLNDLYMEKRTSSSTATPVKATNEGKHGRTEREAAGTGDREACEAGEADEAGEEDGKDKRSQGTGNRKQKRENNATANVKAKR